MNKYNFFFCIKLFFTVPKVFAFVFNIVKKFLDEYTLSKILIYKNEPKKWQAKLFDSVDPSQIPVYFGGTMTDEDDNPKCQSKVYNYIIFYN